MGEGDARALHRVGVGQAPVSSAGDRSSTGAWLVCVSPWDTLSPTLSSATRRADPAPHSLRRARDRFSALMRRGSPSAAPPTGVAFSGAFSLLADHSSHTQQLSFALEGHMILMV